MKKNIFIVIIAFVCQTLNAQEQTSGHIQYRGAASMGLGIDLSDNNTPNTLIISTTHGTYINNNIFVGGGAELKSFVTTRDNFAEDEMLYRTKKFLITVFFDFGHDFRQIGKFVPYTELKYGYSFNIPEEYNYDNKYVSGIYLMPMVGMRLSHTSIWVGYNYIEAKYNMHAYEQEMKIDNLHCLAFGISLNFGKY